MGSSPRIAFAKVSPLGVARVCTLARRLQLPHVVEVAGTYFAKYCKLALSQLSSQHMEELLELAYEEPPQRHLRDTLFKCIHEEWVQSGLTGGLSAILDDRHQLVCDLLKEIRKHM
jgi:hypothetical protein